MAGFERIYSGSTFGRNRTKIREMFREIFLGPFQIGDGTNYTEIGADGSVRYFGDATVFNDIQGNLVGRSLSSTAGKVDYNWAENTITMNSGGSIEVANDLLIWNIQMDHAAKADAPLDLHMHWEQTDAVAREVTVRYRIQDQGAAKTTSWTDVVITIGSGSDAFTYVSGTLNQITGLVSIPTVGLGVSTVIEFKMARTDVVAGDIEVTFVDGHIEKDSGGGSRQTYVK